MPINAPDEITLDDLTSRTTAYNTTTDLGRTRVTDPGALDAIVFTLRQELKLMVDNQQLTAKELGLILGESLAGIVNAAVQFTLTKDESYYNAITAQKRSEIADKELEIATTNAEIAKAKLEQENLQRDVLAAQTQDNIISRELDGFILQYAAARDLEASLAQQESALMANGASAADIKIITDAKEVAAANKTSFQQAVMAAAADISVDGNTTTRPVRGQIGKQKELLTEQVQAYKQRAANDYASLFVEAFAVQYSSNPSATATALVNAVDGSKLVEALKLSKDALDPTS